MQQPIRMMHALSVTRDFLANHTTGIRITHRAADATHGACVEDLYIQRTSAGAIVRADGGGGAKRGVHVLNGGVEQTV
jgi:hypothetical protein